jgi:hypothetical protein
MIWRKDWGRMFNVEECRCATCAECGGSGQVEVRTGGYPETELESCTECRGYGISEMCAYCEERKELAESMETP